MVDSFEVYSDIVIPTTTNRDIKRSKACFFCREKVKNHFPYKTCLASHGRRRREREGRGILTWKEEKTEMERC